MPLHPSRDSAAGRFAGFEMCRHKPGIYQVYYLVYDIKTRKVYTRYIPGLLSRTGPGPDNRLLPRRGTMLGPGRTPSCTVNCRRSGRANHALSRSAKAGRPRPGQRTQGFKSGPQSWPSGTRNVGSQCPPRTRTEAPSGVARFSFSRPRPTGCSFPLLTYDLYTHEETTIVDQLFVLNGATPPHLSALPPSHAYWHPCPTHVS